MCCNYKKAIHRKNLLQILRLFNLRWQWQVRVLVPLFKKCGLASDGLYPLVTNRGHKDTCEGHKDTPVKVISKETCWPSRRRSDILLFLFASKDYFHDQFTSHFVMEAGSLLYLPLNGSKFSIYFSDDES